MRGISLWHLPKFKKYLKYIEIWHDRIIWPGNTWLYSLVTYVLGQKCLKHFGHDHYQVNGM